MEIENGKPYSLHKSSIQRVLCRTSIEWGEPVLLRILPINFTNSSAIERNQGVIIELPGYPPDSQLRGEV